MNAVVARRLAWRVAVQSFYRPHPAVKPDLLALYFVAHGANLTRRRFVRSPARWRRELSVPVSARAAPDASRRTTGLP